MGEPQTTNMDRFQALGVILLLASAIPQVRASLTSDCVDTDNGAIGKYNIGCTVIDDGNTNYCGGIATDDDFVAGEMCCACGGRRLVSAEPSSQPSSQPSSAEPSSQPSSQPSSSPTTAPMQTTCRDLKTVYQNNTCCGLNTTKAATFTNTPTTCGAVLDSYKSSACCSASLNKSAVMNF